MCLIAASGGAECEMKGEITSTFNRWRARKFEGGNGTKADLAFEGIQAYVAVVTLLAQDRDNIQPAPNQSLSQGPNTP
jgi:hypothetical protein